MAFLFVDRIDSLDADQARGHLDLSAMRGELPAWLVTEAIGQLAGWIAMQRTDFRSRPVAALVADLRLGDARACAAGGPLTLEARIERCDSRAVLYAGAARCGDVLIAELRRSVGPLLPLELFDDPQEMRRRAADLLAGRGPRRVMDGLPRGVLEAVTPRAGGGLDAQLTVPQAAAFFADHFPRRPVYPATLLADALAQLAARAAAEALHVPPQAVRLVALRDFKVRAFSEPGQTLALTAVPEAPDGAAVRVRLAAEADGRRVASGALDCLAAP